VNILLLATYELGHQPLSLASPLAFLAAADYRAVACDLSVEPFPEEEARGADLVAISTPMHTAMRLGESAARHVRAVNSRAVICFYGLYAWLNRDYLLKPDKRRALADVVIAGEYEKPLVDLVEALENGRPAPEIAGLSFWAKTTAPYRERIAHPMAVRSQLPPLAKYARFVQNGRAVPAGYVEASRGCLHTCRHCPVVPVYQGRFFVVPLESVLADIAQLAEMGAQHITFGDPDFLNGPGHALRVVRAMRKAFPQMTFDFTTKVEHIVEKSDVVRELAGLGAAFVVSAFESTSDAVLEKLNKGHTLADMEWALHFLGEIGLPIQPTWMPFTPWTTLADYMHMLEWIADRKLICHVPPVQYSIRLLIPPDSNLLAAGENSEWLGPLEATNYSYRWDHPDPRMDALQRHAAAAAETAGSDHWAAFTAVRSRAFDLAGIEAPALTRPPDIDPPRLTEDWFC
jgi:radical SAM superfamily enzyme YgiQ (UPF0313 family)